MEELASRDGEGGHTRTRSVELPEHLVEHVEARLERSGFDTPDDYVAFVVEEVLARVETYDPETRDDDAAESRTDDGDGELEKRLESLGYLE